MISQLYHTCLNIVASNLNRAIQSSKSRFAQHDW